MMILVKKYGPPVAGAIALSVCSTIFEKTVLPKFPIEKLFQKHPEEQEDPISKAAREAGL